MRDAQVEARLDDAAQADRQGGRRVDRGGDDLVHPQRGGPPGFVAEGLEAEICRPSSSSAAWAAAAAPSPPPQAEGIPAAKTAPSAVVHSDFMSVDGAPGREAAPCGSWCHNDHMTADTSAPPPLRDTVLRDIAAMGGVRRYPAHTLLIHEGDDASALFIILSGRVKVFAANVSGKEVILNTHGPGEYVGELALDGGVRSASVMTLEPTSCAMVRGDQLREFIVAHPDFAMHLIQHLIHRVRGLTGSVKSLALEDVYSRVVGLLQQLAVPEGTQRVVPERLTQQDIAERVGSSREMVSRIFKELTAGDYVALRDGRIVLLKTPPAAW